MNSIFVPTNARIEKRTFTDDFIRKNIRSGLIAPNTTLVQRHRCSQCGLNIKSILDYSVITLVCYICWLYHCELNLTPLSHWAFERWWWLLRCRSQHWYQVWRKTGQVPFTILRFLFTYLMILSCRSTALRSRPRNLQQIMAYTKFSSLYYK